VPLSSPVRAAIASDPDLLTVALTGGDDYELIFTAPRSSGDTIQALSKTLVLPLTAIGRVDYRRPKRGKADARVLGLDGCPLDLGTPGYQHF
jgi:thiamine-monophosphate kinase